MRRANRQGVARGRLARIDRYFAMLETPPAETARRAVAGPAVVGLGASAGGLEALQSFFSHVPRQSGLAYVVVQRLDPTQPALLSQLLQRVTLMPVQEARQGVFIEVDQVYVIPPNREAAGGEIARRVKRFTHPPATPRMIRGPRSRRSWNCRHRRCLFRVPAR